MYNLGIFAEKSTNYQKNSAIRRYEHGKMDKENWLFCDGSGDVSVGRSWWSFDPERTGCRNIHSQRQFKEGYPEMPG